MESNSSKNIISNIGAIGAGFVTAMLFGISIYKFGKVIDPPPISLTFEDIGAVERFYVSHPVFLEFVLAGHLIGVFFGTYVTALLAKNHEKMFAYIVGGLCLILGIVVVIHFSHPLWFVILNTLGYLPLAYFGAKLGKRNHDRVEGAPDFSSL